MTKRPTTRKRPTELKVKGSWLVFQELYNFWCFKTAIKLELEPSDLESLMSHDYLSYRQETISVSSILIFPFTYLKEQDFNFVRLKTGTQL